MMLKTLFLLKNKNMKRIVLIMLICLCGGMLYAQNEVGVWETFDNKRNKAMSHVQVYKQDGKLYGKVIQKLI